MKYLITGAKGQLGLKLTQFLQKKDLNYIAFGKEKLDITNKNLVQEIFKKEKPDIVINCAAYNLVDKAEELETLAYSVNVEGLKNLTRECKKYGSFLVHFSTNYVFDGKSDKPYKEEDKTNPLNVYGKTKLESEKVVQKDLDHYLLIRPCWLYGEGNQNFIYKFLQRVRNGSKLMGTYDDIANPTSTQTAAEIILQALDKKIEGLYHICNTGETSRWEWAKEILNIIGDNSEIEKVSIKKFNLPAERPVNGGLDNSKIQKALGIKIPDWKTELKRFMEEQKYFDI